MKPTGCVVRGVPELPARVEPGVDHLDTAEARARFLVDGDAAGVIHDLDGAVLMEGYRDAVAETGEGLVNGVVDDLPQAVSVDPMYMAGRLRTASRPSRTSRFLAP